jgi:hypothetical protein
MNELIEAWNCEDAYCSGLHSVEDAGDGMLRFRFYVTRNDGRHLSVQLIMPATRVPDAILKLTGGLALARAEGAKAFAAADPERVMQ